MSLMIEDVVFIIPVYNEAKVIRGVVEEVRKHFKYVVCVNDGSQDSSAIETVKAKGILVDHPINMGQGAALQTGIEFALTIPKIKYFVTYDADGQHRLKDVESMLKVIRNGKYDIILGSRFMGEAKNISSTKKVILKMGVTFSNLTSGVRLTDTHNGLRVFNRTVAENLNIRMADMSHASEIIEKIGKKKFRYTEVPVVIEYTDYSRSKGQSVINAINIGFDAMLRKIFK